MSAIWTAEEMAVAKRDKQNLVNLDALLSRADIYESADPITADVPALRITDLEEASLTYTLLRKPDFQRETANWTPKQVAVLIATFSKSDIIPAIILWQNGNRIFVVDGAHRLSALIAWVQNDYGAGTRSMQLFGTRIPEQQRRMHEQTQELVNVMVGPWEKFRLENAIVSMKSLQVQWIEGHTPKQAAAAFIRINQGGTEIEPLEVRILNAARSALAVSTRAITRGGTGHPYWKHFSSEDAKSRTPKLGAEISRLLFEPPLESPIKTPDVPLAGAGYGWGVIHIAFDLVALANKLSVSDSTRKVPVVFEPLADDESGDETLQYLLATRKVIRRILSNDPSSLGLHPALYFYSAAGVFQPAALLNAIAWVREMERRDALGAFHKVRGAFEDLIIAHPAIAKPAAHKLGSGRRTRRATITVYERLIGYLGDNRPEVAWELLKVDFPILAADDAHEQAEAEFGEEGAPFTRGAKSGATLSGLAAVERCGLCGGLLHRNGKTVDHEHKRSQGGTSARLNARWVHPICNSNREIWDG